ncbi:MAG: S24/S26 family peptidase [Clostridia bacterium]|nr:S24/S26 family peptidase [Clostridia bacterium]
MNNKGFSELIKLLPKLFESEKYVSIEPKGASMLPTIKEGDKVYLCKSGELHKYDIVLFTKPDGKAILHRLIGKDKDGYIFRGDSQSVKEKGITPENVVAKVAFVERNGKKIKTSGFLFYLRSFVVLHLKYIKRMFS